MNPFIKRLLKWNAEPLGVKDYSVLVLIWFFFELVWFLFLGVNFDLEAKKYINQALYLKESGGFSQARFLFYSTTIFVNYFSFWLGTGLYGSLIFLIIFNLACYLYFYKACAFFFASKIKAFIIVVFLLSFWPYQEWTLTLYSESIFCSAILLLLGKILLFKKLDWKYIFGISILLMVIVFTRPMGILLVFSTLCFLFFYLNRMQKIFFLTCSSLSLIGLLVIVQIVFTTTSDWSMSRAILDESMICDMPVEKSGYIPDLSNSSNQMYQLFYFVFFNFKHFISLALPRLKLFFLMIRDYYSVLHNVYLLIYLVFLYTMIFIGIRKLKNELGLARIVFILMSFVLFGGVVALQCDDYHSRFFLSLFPLLVIAAAASVFSFLNKCTIFSELHKY